ncbi:MAG: hypothetical protein V2A61_04485 [Calditrichota bacterium]
MGFRLWALGFSGAGETPSFLIPHPSSLIPLLVGRVSVPASAGRTTILIVC